MPLHATKAIKKALKHDNFKSIAVKRKQVNDVQGMMVEKEKNKTRQNSALKRKQNILPFGKNDLSNL